MDDIDEFYDDDGSGWEQAIDDCGLLPELGLCTKAGSEDCDFDCPFSRETRE